jgi:hypothetical protein
VITAVLILGGLALFNPSGSPDSAVSPAVAVESTSTSTLATTSTSSTLLTTSTTAAPDTTVPSTTTSKPRRSGTTTLSTLLPPGGVSFALPTQYITANDIRADVNVDRIRVKRGESVNVSVRVSAVFINPFDSPGISTLTELIAACRAIIGVDVTVPPTPGWSPSVSVSLLGTGASAGGPTQLIVIGNKATECGDVLTSTNPVQINVVRITYFREVPLILAIPPNLQAGKYQLVLDPFPFATYLKTTPLEIAVDD